MKRIAATGSSATTEVLIANSVLAGVNAPQAAPVLLALPGWPQALLPGNDQSLYPGLNWQIESSAVCGWQKLILGELGETKVVRDGAALRAESRCQQRSVDLGQIDPGPADGRADYQADGAHRRLLPVRLGCSVGDRLGYRPPVGAHRVLNLRAFRIGSRIRLANITSISRTTAERISVSRMRTAFKGLGKSMILERCN